ncbi:MAG: hypothetical protein SGI90_02095 [Candidatus Eisenbacteria bacterium]|nr:hypothetical protein [Candidatus Eisenbacteria bacterium]
MSDSQHDSGPPASRESLSAGHEVSEVHPKPIITFLVGIILFSALSFVIVVVLFKFLAGDASRKSARPSPMIAAGATRQAPEPRLQTDAWGDWDAYKMNQDRLLEHYSWVDKESLIVRLPIGRAMEIVLERGLPQRPGVMPPPPAGDLDPSSEVGGRMAPPGGMQMKPPPSTTEPVHGTDGGGHR